MKELLEIIAAAIAACWQTLSGVVAHLIAVRVELWQLLGFLPLLFACVIKVRDSRSGDCGNDKVPPPETRHGQVSVSASASVEEDSLPAAKESIEEVICDPLNPSPPASGPGPSEKEGLATPLQHSPREQVEHVLQPAPGVGQPCLTASPTPSPQPKFEPAAPAREPLPKARDAAPPPLCEATVLEAMSACNGIVNVTLVAAQLKTPRDLLWNFISFRPALLDLVESGRRAMAGLADFQLRDAVAKRQGWAAKFVLETKGADAFSGISGILEPIPSPKTPSRPPSNQADPGNGERPSHLEHVQRLDQAGDRVAKTLRRHAGPLRLAARSLGVTPEQLMDYLLLRPDLQAAFGDRREELLDHAETILQSNVKEMKPWAIRFVLLTLGQTLGYVKPVIQRTRGHRPPASERAQRSAKPKPAVEVERSPAPLTEQSSRAIEVKLREKLSVGEPCVVRLLLEKMGAARGYGAPEPRRPAEPPPKKPVGVRDLTRLTPEERDEYLKLRAKMSAIPDGRQECLPHKPAPVDGRQECLPHKPTPRVAPQPEPLVPGSSPVAPQTEPKLQSSAIAARAATGPATVGPLPAGAPNKLPSILKPTAPPAVSPDVTPELLSKLDAFCEVFMNMSLYKGKPPKGKRK